MEEHLGDLCHSLQNSWDGPGWALLLGVQAAARGSVLGILGMLGVDGHLSDRPVTCTTGGCSGEDGDGAIPWQRRHEYFHSKASTRTCLEVVGSQKALLSERWFACLCFAL